MLRPMVHRILALLSLLVVGFVLPAAGAPMRFCVMNLTFLMADQPCCGCLPDAESGDCEDCECIIGAKVLPDGLIPDGLLVPSVAAIPVSTLKVPTATKVTRLPPISGAPFERGPPPGPPLYLLKRSLLI